MRTMMINIDALIAENDLCELVERAGGKIVKGRSNCPLHGGENPTAFSVYEDGGKQKWICRTGDCGQGDLIDFVKVWQNLSFKEALKFLGGDVMGDSLEMERLAKERHERAVKEKEAAHLKEEARRKELQAEQKHLYYHEHMNDFLIEQWLKRGLDESWQGFFCLGGCEDFVINDNWHTPTLTIPIKNEKYEVLNIKHRLINPQTPKDKYRPEKSGLGAFPYFLTFPDMGYGGDVIWVLEGEIKACVTATISPDLAWNYIGVPGMSQYKGLSEKLCDKNVIVVSDPGAEKETTVFCKSVKGRILELPEKIDDLIVAHGYDGDWLRSLEKQARRIA
jgi:hypothetical protein